jgi:1,4-dihydroxy-2-naphthoyl-CoA hydrolase
VSGRESILRMKVRRELLAPNGFLHAASVIGLADTAAGYGTVAGLPGNAKGFTTIELKSNLSGTAREGTLLCTARPLHTGRMTQVWDAQVTHVESNKTIAHFRCTQMILFDALNDCLS